ncbi:hypothetical protein NIES4072_27920 [Nostoc commune NIES-4072]|uniref:DUF4870 domain-containing protein n=2 Tax=Nostoc commune TaxID=1178 RepID=A0A2R5FLH8_NOSCO|nr:hypothetical protein NIES4070_62820 [Nostoc commune HK-02]GBG19125.1 hypothetical protein NIES4072_27920 [Nostoc commune NIES-4072]
MSLIHPSSLGVRLTQMKNFEPKENGEWGVGSGEWGDEGDEGTRGQGDKGTRITHAQCPMPNAQCPMPKTQLLLHLIPIIGFFPSLWTLYRGQGSREQLAVSRLSITLALTWLLGYLLLATGAATSDFFSLRLFILNSFLTSGYFLVSVWLILRLMQGKSGRLPGFTTLAERVLGKYLS